MNAKHRPVAFLVFVFAIACVFPAAADQVTDWDAIMFQAALVAPATSPLVMSRNAAIVQSSVFDALNGIERRYTSIYVQPAAPRGASRRAAVVQAAYAALLHLYPSQASTLDLQREASLDAIASVARTLFGTKRQQLERELRVMTGRFTAGQTLGIFIAQGMLLGRLLEG